MGERVGGGEGCELFSVGFIPIVKADKIAKYNRTAMARTLMTCLLVYHGCFELVLESLGKNPRAANLEKFRMIFCVYIENGILCVLIRIALMRRF